jgi:hypothetical protein
MATVTGAQIVDAARAMLGTPYVLHGRLPKVGVDCAGLFVCAAEEHGIRIKLPDDYGRVNRPDYVHHHLAKAMRVVTGGESAPGMVLVTRLGAALRHICLMEDENNCIEAVNDPGVMKVVRRPINWWRVDRTYAIPGVTY